MPQPSGWGTVIFRARKQFNSPTPLLFIELVAESELDTELGKFLGRLENVPAVALRDSKRLLLAPLLEQYRVHLDLERDSIAELITSPESVALQNAFLSKNR